jgi:hypothetical protein
MKTLYLLADYPVNEWHLEGYDQQGTITIPGKTVRVHQTGYGRSIPMTAEMKNLSDEEVRELEMKRKASAGYCEICFGVARRVTAYKKSLHKKP